jgi:hypothetical protein
MSKEFGFLIFPWLLLLTVYAIFPGKEKPVEKPVIKLEEPIVKPDIPNDSLVPSDEISVLGYNNVLCWQKDVNTIAVLDVINKSLKDGKITENEYEEISKTVDAARYGDAKYELLNPKTKIYPKL